MTLSERSLPLSDEELKMTGQLVLRAMKHQQLESICSLMGQYGEEGLAFRRLVFFFGITGCNKSDAEWVPRAAWCDLFFLNKLEIPGGYILVKSNSCEKSLAMYLFQYKLIAFW